MIVTVKIINQIILNVKMVVTIIAVFVNVLMVIQVFKNFKILTNSKEFKAIHYYIFLQIFNCRKYLHLRSS